MRTPLFLTAAGLSLSFALTACGGEVTGGGTGSDTDPERIEDRSVLLAEPERDQIAGDDMPTQDVVGQPAQEGADKVPEDALRAEDYPAPGQEMTRWPIEPGNEEPGGKDMLLAQEYAAMDTPVPETQRPALEEARAAAQAGLVTVMGRTYLTHRGAAVGALLGSEAVGPEGERVGEVADLSMSDTGRVDAVFVAPGGIPELDGEVVSIDGDAVTIRPRTGEMGGPVMVLDERIGASTPRIEDDAIAGRHLASTMIGSPVRLASGETVSIADIVVTEDGEVEGMVLSLQGEVYALPFGAFAQSQNGGGLYVSIARDALRNRPFYVGEPAYSAAQ